MAVVLETNIPYPVFGRGKVRDVYDLGDKLLIVVTDRISAFDSILPNGIPKKGEVLNKISKYWFNQTKDIIPNHMITTDVKEYPKDLRRYSDLLVERSMLVKKTKPLPIECVARGYLAGSGWKEYLENGRVCGIELPKGLKESDKLPKTIYTPATKAESGHDINISYEESVEIVGEEIAKKVRDATIKLYEFAAEKTNENGIIICDTKFEFGILDGELILIDEALTPDSSRFWPKDSYVPGGAQKSYDKQYVRDYLIGINWDREPPAPELTNEVIENTSKKYIQAYELITGETL